MSGIFPATRHKSPPGRGGFMDEGIGERFLRETRHSRGHLVGGRTDWARQPSWFKSYPEAPRVALPPVTSGAGAPADAGLFDVLARRRSVREYGPPPLDLEELGGLLWAAAEFLEVEWRRPVLTHAPPPRQHVEQSRVGGACVSTGLRHSTSRNSAGCCGRPPASRRGRWASPSAPHRRPAASSPSNTTWSRTP